MRRAWTMTDVDSEHTEAARTVTGTTAPAKATAATATEKHPFQPFD